jgi:hypothetical protein
MHNQGFVPYYESTVRLLAQRGHAVHLAFNQPFKPGEAPLAEMLAASTPAVSFSPAPPRGDAWSALATAVRGAMDYLRYLHPIYKGARKLRQRALVWPSGLLLWIATLPLLRTPAGLRFLTHGLKLIERAIPTSRTIERFITSHRPDVVLVTPLVETASKQVDYVKTARALGIKTALCVASWDNLTNKGLIRVEPDLVIVWNEFQKQEAVELHHIPPGKIAVTGAQLFDEWFDREPSSGRQEFCARVGLPPERPILLYVCSSPLIAEKEVPFVREWLRHVRTAANSIVSQAGIIVRPHPQNAAQWGKVDLSEFGDVVVWPTRSANRLDVGAKADFFDSLYHSAAVVGINTSALIEAGIVGRSVFTILAPEYRETQEQMPQFQHLLRVGGGLLRIADSFELHLAQLSSALEEGCAGTTGNNRDFIAQFVRPRGLAEPCTPIVVQAVESLCKHATPMDQLPLWSYPVRVLLFPLAFLMNQAWLAIKQKRLQTLASE